MCFGRDKERRGDEPPPRPVQNLGGREDDVKTSRYNNPPNPSSSSSSGGGAGGAGEGGPLGYQKHGAPMAVSGPSSTQKQEQLYAPPAGPPPDRQKDQYAPPPGPPPGRRSDDWIAPSSGPSASQSKAEHDWQAAVPDTSLFPPPPAIFSGYDRSPTNNATEEQAIAGEEWCEQYPLVRPMVLDDAAKAALQFNNVRLMEPTDFGAQSRLSCLGPGHWEGQTDEKADDRCIIGYPPLYVVNEHDPTVFGRPRTIYYEVKIRPDSRTVNLALGFAALPYPSFRLPGWHRGSLAVHGDDGHKYINDRWGGKDFTAAFRKGETYGVGMTFAPPPPPPPPAGPATDGRRHRPRVDVFFTRNGSRTAGWDLHEETDAEQDLPVTGLEGFHDLSCAIGAFEGTSFEVVFDPARWMYKEAMFDL